MDFQKLQYFISVAELCSFSKAAEKCFVSQPALTRAIKGIEDETGVKLFDRTKSPIKLTYAGERYLTHALEIMRIKGELDREITDIILHKKDRLILGIPHTRGANWVPRIFPAFYQEYPNIDIQVVEGTSVELEKKLLAEELDLFVLGTTPIMTKGIEIIPFYQEQMCVILSRQSEALKGMDLPENEFGVLQYLPPQLLNEIPYISALPSQGTYHLSRQIFEKFHLSPKMLLEPVNASIAYHLAPMQKGFAFGPATISYEENFNNEPIFCSITEEPIVRQAGILYKAGRRLSPAAEAFIQKIGQIIVDYVAANIPSFQIRHDIPFET